MANLRLYPSGFTAFQPSSGNSSPPPRSSVSGWSRGATRSLVRFLYSVDFSGIAGNLYSFTLTVRDCPDTSDDWIRVRKAFFRRLSHRGVSDLLWLTEWQRRGVPHLHGIVVLPSYFSNPAEFLRQWLGAAKVFRPNGQSQFMRPIYDPVGWSEYLGKHSARGVQNYQRCSSSMPAGWNGKTGRMWGHRGNIPTMTPIDLQFTEPVFFRLRRVLRSRAVASARSRHDSKAIKYARTMLKHPDPVVSRVRGLSQFSAIDSTLVLVQYLATLGRIEN